MQRLFLFAFFILIIFISGCAKEQPPVAGLVPMPPETAVGWEIPGNLNMTGQGNSYKIVKGPSLGAPFALELAAGGQGSVEYFREINHQQTKCNVRLQFLSTQGVGRVALAAYDAQNRVIGKVVWVYTGPLPEGDSAAKWIDCRYGANYTGNWIVLDGSSAELFAKNLPEADIKAAVKYRLSIEAGQGQHALITDCKLSAAYTLAVTPVKASFNTNIGDIVLVEADIENSGGTAVEKAQIEIIEPTGHGINVLTGKRQFVEKLLPGEKRRLSWQVKAQRPDAVNFNKPWAAGFSIDGVTAATKLFIAVADNRPGTVYYVMTEDLEPIDSAGYSAAWGNADGWLEPQELSLQMVAKAERVNNIAEKYGAKWTHYIAMPVLNAAGWAATQSNSGQWPKVIAEIKGSIVSQSARGHEYGLHMHSDYDPYLPGNVLSYNSAVDGIWANHLRHGWAHSLPVEGDLGNYSSRTGILFNYQKVLDELQAGSPSGQIVTARAGSFDFGNGANDEAMSTRAYRKVGLLAGSDAEGNRGRATAGDYGREIYISRPDNISSPAVDLANVGIVQFRPTPLDFINYDSQSALVMNGKADQGMAAFNAGGSVKAGVHAIVGFTHVMFILGEDGWQSLQGGQFAALDEHLRYLKDNYVDKGTLKFATASELVKAYLDYYTPEPLAVYGPKKSGGWGVDEYRIDLLGKDILIDPEHPFGVSLKYPLYLRDSAFRVVILKSGQPVYSTWGLPTPANDIVFNVDDAKAEYVIKIYHNKYLQKILSIFKRIRAKI